MSATGTSADSVLLVVDIQGKLATLMDQHARFFEAARRMVLGAKALDIPVLLVEQLPDKLGTTIEPVAEVLDRKTFIPKSTFSALKNETLAKALKETGKQHVIVIGIEAHICVYQTVCDLLDQQYSVSVVTDAVASRAPDNKALALANMQQSGAALTSTEMLLFALMESATHPAFKTIQQLVK